MKKSMYSLFLFLAIPGVLSIMLLAEDNETFGRNSLNEFQNNKTLLELISDEVLYVKETDELCPVVGVKDNRTVIVKLPSGGAKSVRYDSIHRQKVQLTELPEEGITVCSQKADIKKSMTVDAGTWSTGVYDQQNIVFEWKLVANHTIRDVYVVLYYNTKPIEGENREFISMHHWEICVQEN